MKCEICGKEILRDSQCINYKYYHNDCIENLQQENEKLKQEVINLAKEVGRWNSYYDDEFNENQKLKKEIDILLNVQEECEKSLYKIRELKKELNQVNDENEKLKEQLKKCKKDNNELRKDKLECYMKYTTILTSLNKFVEYLEKRYKDITSVIGSYGSNTDMLYGKKNMTEEILTEFKNMVEEFQKTEQVKEIIEGDK